MREIQSLSLYLGWKCRWWYSNHMLTWLIQDYDVFIWTTRWLNRILVVETTLANRPYTHECCQLLLLSSFIRFLCYQPCLVDANPNWFLHPNTLSEHQLGIVSYLSSFAPSFIHPVMLTECLPCNRVFFYSFISSCLHASICQFIGHNASTQIMDCITSLRWWEELSWGQRLRSEEDREEKTAEKWRLSPVDLGDYWIKLYLKPVNYHFHVDHLREILATCN